MANTNIEIDFSEYDRFFERLSEAGRGEFKQQLSFWLEAMGIEFLDVVKDEIIRKQVVDTRLLLNSFQKGDADGVWRKSNGGLTLEVGTNVKYARLVNDGHRQQKRWVPGRWNGSKFEYDPGASTGMMLTARFVEGKHYWDSALVIFEQIFCTSLENNLQQWMNSII